MSFSIKVSRKTRIQNLANFASRIDALLGVGVKVVTNLVQRNLSPTASLLIHTKRLGVSVKEKTPHQDKGEALNLTFCAPNPEAGGRTTTGSDKSTIVLR